MAGPIPKPPRRPTVPHPKKRMYVPTESTAWRKVAVFGAFITAIGLAMYPIAIYPMLHPEYYQDIQRKARAGLDVEKIQPGGMKVWTDPFGRKKEGTADES